MIPPKLPEAPVRPDTIPLFAGRTCGTTAKLAPLPASVNIAATATAAIRECTGISGINPMHISTIPWTAAPTLSAR